MEQNLLREVQLKELELLIEIDRICKKHNIKYFLSWGSALGAVRHKGFIPWDDDIDISMFWEDYKKFEMICREELDNNYFYQSQKTDPNNWQSWNRIRINNTTAISREHSFVNCHWGLFIDIFPVFFVPSSKWQRLIQQKCVTIYNFLSLRPLELSRPKKNYHKKSYILFSILPKFFIEFVKKQCINIISKYNSESCDLCSELLDSNIVFSKDLLMQLKDAEFEENIFPIPENHDEYLTLCYGDYMMPPSIEEQHGHENIIIDLYNSYEKYQK